MEDSFGWGLAWRGLLRRAGVEGENAEAAAAKAVRRIAVLVIMLALWLVDSMTGWNYFCPLCVLSVPFFCTWSHFGRDRDVTCNYLCVMK
jgi:hypothetical protein